MGPHWFVIGFIDCYQELKVFSPAAHCVDFNTPPSQVHLYGGSTSRISGGHLFFVQRYVLHPSYGRVTLDFDIAIIEVNVSCGNSIPVID